jgi:hypothetical protein
VPVIKVTVRSVYGLDKVYPANDAARTLANIAGTKTLSVANLRDARALGCTIECIADVPDLAIRAVLTQVQS